MSYSVIFKAETKDAALRQLDKETALPAEIRDHVKAAVTNTPVEPNSIWHIMAIGHLCTGPGSFGETTCQILVKQETLYR